MSSAFAVPPHLRRYIVRQDYGAYTERDQAVWRFVVGQTHRRLWDSAHPSYRSGFARAGISTQRIPNLGEMDRQLAELGFRVVCVDGFIPPRAFQAFQARGFLPVAADIRRAEHLTYTPAPDIIHEAAGHAPFLAEPDYAHFLKRIGAVSERAFESARDRALYRVIHRLSELKEQPDSTPAQITEAEAELTALRAQPATVSEATRMARLYWWTVEYGLLGTPRDYRLYGAGLLSSIGEAHFCHDPRVRKLPLSAACLHVDYDITQAQPQLFVAQDFAQLPALLTEVEQTLSHVRGGDAALQNALESEEVATVELDNGLCLSGTLRGFDAGVLRLEGRCALSEAGRVLQQYPALEAGYVLPLGALEDGTPLSTLTPEALGTHCKGPNLSLHTRDGVHIEGELERLEQREGRVRVVVLRHARITRGTALLLETHQRYPWLLASRAVTATPLAPDGYYPATDLPATLVPKARAIEADEARLIELHTEVIGLRSTPSGEFEPALGTAIHTALAPYPGEWLLRFELLEALVARGEETSALAVALRGELQGLERHFQGREPIATGLASLDRERSRGPGREL